MENVRADFARLRPHEFHVSDAIASAGSTDGDRPLGRIVRFQHTNSFRLAFEFEKRTG